MNRTAFVTGLALLSVIGLAAFAWQFATVLLLAFAGLLLSVLVRHAARALSSRTPMPVGAAMAIILATFAGIAALFVVAAGPRIAAELTEVAESLPGAIQDVETWIKGTRWGDYVLRALPDAEGQTGWNIAGMLGGTVTSLLAVVANIVVVLATAIFLAVDPGLYRRGVLHLVPKPSRDRAAEVLDTLGGALWRWLLGQSLDMVAVALMTGLGLWLIGVPAPVALGLIAGLTNFIPYVGPFLSGIPATLIGFSQSPTVALYTALLFLAVQQVEGNLLMPVIQKRATSLPPVLTILAVVGLGSLFGLLGALLATPLMLVGIILVRMLYVEDVLGDRDGGGP